MVGMKAIQLKLIHSNTTMYLFTPRWQKIIINIINLVSTITESRMNMQDIGDDAPAAEEIPADDVIEVEEVVIFDPPRSNCV